MIAQVVDMEPFEFIYSLGDTHIYLDQMEIVEKHLKREPVALPKLKLNPEIKSIFDFTEKDIEIVDYNPIQPPLSYPVAM